MRSSMGNRTRAIAALLKAHARGLQHAGVSREAGAVVGTRVLFAEIEGIAAAAQRHVDAELGESRTPGYAILNVKGGVQARRIRFAAGVGSSAELARLVFARTG